MVVQHNMQAMNANRMLNVTTGNQAKSTEKLSSGYRINRAADDAAGLSISEKMRKQIRGLDQASTNAQDGVSAVQTAEGALTEVHSMLQRMNELSVQAANGTNSTSDREAIQDEIEELTKEIDRVAETTKFNEAYMLKGQEGVTKRVYMNGHHAGLSGTLQDESTTAYFRMDALKQGDKVTIAGQQYTIGVTKTDAEELVDKAIAKAADSGNEQEVYLDGKKYTVAKDGTIKDSNGNQLSGLETTPSATLDKAALKKLIKAGTADDLGTTVKYGDKELQVMTDVEKGGDGIDDNDATIITADKAYELAAAALKEANQVGVTDGEVNVTKIGGTATIKEGTTLYDAAGKELEADDLALLLDNNGYAFSAQPTAAAIGDVNAGTASVYTTNAVTQTGTTANDDATIRVSYVDAEGNEQTKDVSFKTGASAAATQANIIAAINADTTLKDIFTAADGGGDKITLTAKGDNAGKTLHVTGITTTVPSAQAVSLSGGTLTTAGADKTLNTTDLYDKVTGAKLTNDTLQAAFAKGNAVKGTAAVKDTDYTYTEADADQITFKIDKGYAEVNDALSLNLHVGSDSYMSNKIIIRVDPMNANYLGITGLNVLDDSGRAATYAIDAIADAIEKVSAQRSALGAIQNRLEHSIANLDNVVENTTAAESRIRDTDMAEQMVDYSKNNILAQAGQSMLAQANQSTQGVLSLLQ